ncbi:MAG: hypothetical protein JWR44_1829 [Hymenobacter sp.]|nr:hypothetical protein [Hymenobacter sp.]
MFDCCLTLAFPDSARQRLFDAVAAALQEEAGAASTLLLGNLAVEADGAPLDAVVLRPHGITLLVFVPHGGQLSIPALGYGSWLLNGAPLPGQSGSDNPYEQFVQQKAALEAWLQPQFSPEQANLRFITGIVVFGAPVTFSPDVEAALNSASANGFQLLTNPAELPRRLRQLATPEIDLTDEDLAELTVALPQAARVPADDFQEESQRIANPSPKPAAGFSSGGSREPASYSARQEATIAAPGNFFALKFRQLWGWLGADDIPADPPYGDESAARSIEKQQLEQVRQQMQADVAAQLQAMEARESERERSIAQLRSQLAQAPPVAPEAAAIEARIAAESREKEALESAMRASRAESAARNQELDAKIQQLGQLIDRLNSGPAEPAPFRPGGAATAPEAVPGPERAASGVPLPPAVQPAPWAVSSFRQLRVWRRRLPRLAAIAGLGAVLGLGAWGLSRLGSSPPVPYQENGRWGFADAKGQPVIPAQFTSATPFQAGRAVVAKDGAYGILDEDGKEVVAPAYDALNPYAGGYARVRVGEAYTFVDEKGEEFDTYYFNARDFAEGYAAVLDHRGWHYISGPSEAAKPVIFIEAYAFVDGLARVKLADGYTFITPDYLDDPSEGTKPFGRYQLAADFDNGRAQVTQNGRSFWLDKQGNEVN